VLRKKEESPDVDAVDPVSGQDIKRHRELRNISLDEIKEKTKIGKFTLNLIEEDAYASLPAPVYLKSFLRQIAELIGMDPEKTVRGYFKRMNETLKKSRRDG